MTSFGWKKKSSLKTRSSAVFGGEGSSKREEDELWEREGVDWLTAAKRRRLILLEDNRTKSKRQASKITPGKPNFCAQASR